MTDQQTHTAMQCAGNPHLRTPALHALAARVVRFFGYAIFSTTQ